MRLTHPKNRAIPTSYLLAVCFGLVGGCHYLLQFYHLLMKYVSVYQGSEIPIDLYAIGEIYSKIYITDFGVLLFGFFALISGVGMLLGRRWGRPLGWVALLSYGCCELMDLQDLIPINSLFVVCIEGGPMVIFALALAQPSMERYWADLLKANKGASEFDCENSKAERQPKTIISAVALLLSAVLLISLFVPGVLELLEFIPLSGGDPMMKSAFYSIIEFFVTNLVMFIVLLIACINLLKGSHKARLWLVIAGAVYLGIMTSIEHNIQFLVIQFLIYVCAVVMLFTSSASSFLQSKNLQESA